MALDIYAAKDLNHAFEIASMDSEKRMEDHEVSEPEEIGDFLYDTRNELTNYTYYYQFDPYRETQLEADQVPTIRAFADSVLNWISVHGAEENRVIHQYGLSFQKIRCFADELGRVCDVAMEHEYGLSGMGD